MIAKERIQQLAEERITELDNGLYIVEIRVSTTNVIHVELDKIKGGVSVEDCISVSRNIEHNLDREEEDFELHVSSAGLDKPFRHINQYGKNIGRTVKITTVDDEKYQAEIVKVTETSVVITYQERVIVDAKKRKGLVEHIIELPLEKIKEAKIVITFK
jgi:ribosome maturation factor RimP